MKGGEDMPEKTLTIDELKKALDEGSIAEGDVITIKSADAGTSEAGEGEDRASSE